MKQHEHVRPAQEVDAVQISALVQHTIRTSTASQYSAASIARVADSFSAHSICQMIRLRLVLVWLDADCIVGTASLEGSEMRAVFVDPYMQCQGIGRQLVAVVERKAFQKGLLTLRVPSCHTAQFFYSRLGYREVGQAWEAGERVVVMEKCLRHLAIIQPSNP